jgi:hypothetical protein
MARRLALFVLTVAFAVLLQFVSQTGWVDADMARLLTVAAVVSAFAAIGVLGVIAVKDHLLDRLGDISRWLGDVFIRVGQRIKGSEDGSRSNERTSDHIQAAKWRRAALTFGTWLYRRDEWKGLSQEARVAEIAPAPYLRKRLNHLDLTDLTLEPIRDIGPEPWWDPPEHKLVAVGGTTATCSCGWTGEGFRFTEHAGGPTPPPLWRSGQPTQRQPEAASAEEGSVDPPALAGVPDVGRETFLNEMRIEYRSLVQTVDTLYVQLWNLSQAEASSETQERRHVRRVTAVLGRTATYAETYWHDNNLVGQAQAAEGREAGSTIGPPWRASLSRQLEFLKTWIGDHRPPGAPTNPA